MEVKPLTRIDATRMPAWQVAYFCTHDFRVEYRRDRLVLVRPYLQRRARLFSGLIRAGRGAVYVAVAAALLGAYFVVSGI